MAEIDELKKVKRCDADADFGEGWYLYSVVDAEDYDRAIAALEESQRALAAMTEDRDLWQGEHGDDCPYKQRAEEWELTLSMAGCWKDRTAPCGWVNKRAEDAEKEGLEQARLLGMSGERELALRAKLEDAEKQVERLKKLLTASENWRVAYQNGKYKLYGMGGIICEAAAEHLPASEGPLDRAVRKEIGPPALHEAQRRADVAEAELATLKGQESAAEAILRFRSFTLEPPPYHVEIEVLFSGPSIAICRLEKEELADDDMREPMDMLWDVDGDQERSLSGAKWRPWQMLTPLAAVEDTK